MMRLLRRFCFFIFCCCLMLMIEQGGEATSNSGRVQTRMPMLMSNIKSNSLPGGPLCPMGCECDTPGVVSCISARLQRLPLRLPAGTKFFYAEHNRFSTAVLTHRNFTNYVGNTGRSTLTGMSLHNCSITLIGFRTFSSLKSLQELDLSNNKITVIEDNTFNGLSLNMLDLSYNVGIQFSKQAFCGCTIRRLALRAVGLKNFDLSTFSFVFPNLMSLSLADNRLLSLDYRLFSCAPNLSTVYFARNPWWCGGDCATLKLINHINRNAGELVMDEAPACQPGYDEQQDPDLNKAECVAQIAAINNSTNPLPECPVTITIVPTSQSFGRSLPSNPSEAAPLASMKHEDELASIDGGFVTWSNGVVANYTPSVTPAPGAPRGDNDGGANGMAAVPIGGCFRLSTVVAASTMASVATLVIVLSSCLCIRACYLRCQNRDQMAAQTPSLYSTNGKTFSSHRSQHNHHSHHQNGTKNGGSNSNNNSDTNYKTSNSSRNGGGTTSLVPSQGQPLLMNHSSSSESSGHIASHVNGSAQTPDEGERTL